MRTEDSLPRLPDSIFGIPCEYGMTGTSTTNAFDAADFQKPWERCAIIWEEPEDTWQCEYCGTKHWIEDKQLQCSKCGGPRDI